MAVAFIGCIAWVGAWEILLLERVAVGDGTGFTGDLVGTPVLLFVALLLVVVEVAVGDDGTAFTGDNVGALVLFCVGVAVGGDVTTVT